MALSTTWLLQETKVTRNFISDLLEQRVCSSFNWSQMLLCYQVIWLRFPTR